MQRFSVTFLPSMRPFVSKIPETLPGGSRLGVIDATSNAGGAAACWAKRAAQKEPARTARRRWKAERNLDLVLRWFDATEVDVVPDAFVDEIGADFQHHVEGSADERETGPIGQQVHDQPGRDRPQQAIADGFGDAAGVGFHA